MRKIVSFLLLWASFNLWSQHVTVQVQVLDEILPAEKIPVTVSDEGKIIARKTTGKNGIAVFELRKGIYTFTAENPQSNKIISRKVRVSDKLTIKLHLQKTEQLPEVVIYTTQADPKTPVTVSEISKKELEKKYVTEDIPYLLEDLPSVVTTSDPGHSVGYTAIRIRGISPQQINVTLNGIPLNDAESHTVYWVDIPDFVSSTEKIQVQRGVGTSTLGTGAFGANIHLQTEKPPRNAFASMDLAFGSFNTQRLTLKAGTGKINDRFSMAVRSSKIHSDGYIDRATADMKSYFLSALYDNGKHELQFIHFGGHERTYQAWYGVDKQTFEENPTFNYAGAIYNDQWEIVNFYENEVDDYTQNHYQLHYTLKKFDRFQFYTNTFYVRGFGYYEQYKQDQDFQKYGITPVILNGTTIDRTDLIRQKWLDNDYFGTNIYAITEKEKIKWTFGLGLDKYLGAHFGRVIWARFAGDSEINHKYYRNLGDKRSLNAFVKNQFQLNPKLYLYTDLQIRSIYYNIHFDPDQTFDPDEKIALNDKLFFVNPKIGLFYQLDQNKSLYFSLAQTHREPNRTDYVENSVKPKPETLNDLESGVKIIHENWSWKSNIYYMHYKDQLVYSGRIDDVGNPVRENVGKSYRTGWENEFLYTNKNWQAKLFFTLSRNRNVQYQAWDGNTLKNFGNTRISFSPDIIGGIYVSYQPAKGLNLKLRYKYVGKQFMDNRNIPESELPAYGIAGSDLNYRIKTGSFIKKAMLTFKINNLFNKKYASNGYMWGDTPYYFPQAGRHYYLGLNIRL